MGRTHAGALWKPPSLLVYDSISRHTTTSMLPSFKQCYHTVVAVIPGQMTLLQLADSHWNNPFKAVMKHRWLDWLQSGEAEFTQAGKRKQASYNLVAQWASDLWKDLPENLIQCSVIEFGLFPSENSTVKLRSIMEEEGVVHEKANHTGITKDEDSEQMKMKKKERTNRKIRHRRLHVECD